jgi:hypothetical protein
MSAYRRPTSRHTGTAAKRAPTQLMAPQRSAGKATTVKLSASPAAASVEPVEPVEPAAAIEHDDVDTSENAAVGSGVRPAAAAPPAKATAPSSKAGAPAPKAAAPAPATPPPATRPASSTRLKAAGGRPGTESRSRRDSRGDSRSESSRQGTARSESSRSKSKTGRVEATPPSSRQRTADKASTRRRGPKAKWPAYVFIGVLAAGIITAFSYHPYQRHLMVKTMDAAKGDPNRLDSALKASDTYLSLVDSDPEQVKSLVANDHGPIEVQIHILTAIKDFPSLVTLAERSDLTPEYRAKVINAAADLYNPGTNASDRLPSRLDEFINDDNANDELAAAAMGLVAKAARPEALASLIRVALDTGSKPARFDAALKSLAIMVDSNNVGQVLPLFSRPDHARVLANAAFCDAVAHVCSTQMDSITALAFGKDADVQPFALNALADHCALPDMPGNEARRTAMAEKVMPLLAKTTPPETLAAALKIVSHMTLAQCVDPVLALAPDIDALNLPGGVNADFLKKCLGQAFIQNTTPDSKKLTEQVIVKLGAALADAKTRTVAAGSLKLITTSEFPSLRLALDQLAAAGDLDSIDALKAIIGTAYGREDVLKAEGDDAATWQAYLAKEHGYANRLSEIRDWIKANGKYMRVADGTKRLQESIAFLQKAADDTKAWVAEPDFLVPLGAAKNDVTDLINDLNMMMQDVKHAIAGAEQGDQAPSPAPAPAAPAAQEPAAGTDQAPPAAPPAAQP